MTGAEKSRTLWISSPHEPGGVMTGPRAAALGTVAAAWQAETPVMSFFCRRPKISELRPGMGMEQVGLVSLVYSFIYQLLQFNREKDLELDERELATLNGTVDSWDINLKVLRKLLNQTPLVLFCIIDGLNDLEYGNGGMWCRQLLQVLKERQQQVGIDFNILFTTTGQSQVLPQYVEFMDRAITTKRAREVVKSGKVISLRTG
jgi:hypothetical protein